MSYFLTNQAQASKHKWLLFNRCCEENDVDICVVKMIFVRATSFE